MLREKSGLTSSETGTLMGDRPHSTILASLSRYSERRKNDAQLIEAELPIYMLREKSGLTSSETGTLMGDRPHSTILASLSRYSERRKNDAQLIEAERRISNILK